MILGSHNSWSYLRPKIWWMRPFAFTARCQSKNIQEQYEKYGVRCFDLRIKFVKNQAYVTHNNCLYCKLSDIKDDLQFLNDKGDVLIRVVFDVRTKKGYTIANAIRFMDVCASLEAAYDKITFWCGRNLYNWAVDYIFDVEPVCKEMYSSVCAPKWIDDWWPWLYAKRNNRKNIQNCQDCDILLIDFVNIS